MYPIPTEEKNALLSLYPFQIQIHMAISEQFTLNYRTTSIIISPFFSTPTHAQRDQLLPGEPEHGRPHDVVPQHHIQLHLHEEQVSVEKCIKAEVFIPLCLGGARTSLQSSLLQHSGHAPPRTSPPHTHRQTDGRGRATDNEMGFRTFFLKETFTFSASQAAKERPVKFKRVSLLCAQQMEKLQRGQKNSKRLHIGTTSDACARGSPFLNFNPRGLGHSAVNQSGPLCGMLRGLLEGIGNP